MEDLDQPAASSWSRAGCPQTLSGLLGLSIIHFARWVIIKRDQWPDLGQGRQPLDNDYMLFCSNFNGTWDQYIDAFSDGIPDGLDLFWYSSTKYPQSIPITAFKDYIRHNQIDTDYYYNATPGAAQRDIKAALRRPSRRAGTGGSARRSWRRRHSPPPIARRWPGCRTRSAPWLRAGREHRHRERRARTAATSSRTGGGAA